MKSIIIVMFFDSLDLLDCFDTKKLISKSILSFNITESLEGKLYCIALRPQKQIIRIGMNIP